jgi:hypothetical protein
MVTDVSLRVMATPMMPQPTFTEHGTDLGNVGEL